jgi:hypothetical protein
VSPSPLLDDLVLVLRIFPSLLGAPGRPFRQILVYLALLLFIGGDLEAVAYSCDAKRLPLVSLLQML